MTVEKINDNRIRAILSREELEKRHIRLSEFAYGTENARTLFRELIRTASYKFGFRTEDMPLMIEAIPVAPDKLMIYVTKVQYPEELDTRFADFSDYDMGDGSDDPMYGMYEDINEYYKPTAADDILSGFDDNESADGAFGSDFVAGITPKAALKKQDVTIPRQLLRLFLFDSIDTVIRLSHTLGGFYHGNSRLYKDKSGGYCLLVYMDDHTPVEFNKVCNILTEYATMERMVPGTEGYLSEHAFPIIFDRALETLRNL